MTMKMARRCVGLVVPNANRCEALVFCWILIEGPQQSYSVTLGSHKLSFFCAFCSEQEYSCSVVRLNLPQARFR